MGLLTKILQSTNCSQMPKAYCDLVRLFYAGADLGGGAMPPPFRIEQVLNAEVYRAFSARSFSDIAHISI